MLDSETCGGAAAGQRGNESDKRHVTSDKQESGGATDWLLMKDD